jgi:HEAT repeat protein
MYPTNRNSWAKWLAVFAAFITSFSLVSAQTPEQQSWSLLSAGAADKSAHTRAIAVRSLGLVPHDSAAEKLAADSLHDSSAEVRIAAATALGHMKATSAIPALKKALRDPDVGVILAAAGSLRLLGDPSAYLVYYAVLTGERKSGQGLVDEEKKMLSDPRKMALFGFETGIGFVPFGGLSYGVYKALTKDDVSPVRAAAAVALAHDPDPKSGEALVKAASAPTYDSYTKTGEAIVKAPVDKTWVIRAAALDAIAQRNDPGLIVGIMSAMADPKPEVQYTAAAAIYHLSKLAESKTN